MKRHMKAKRSMALILSAAMLATSLAPALPVYAQDGWTETQFLGNPVYKVLQDFSFSSEANAQALAAGSIPTGLSHNLTFTRHVPPYEPYAYGKYWLGNERGQAVTNAKVPLASGSGNVTIDFSKIGNHFISCIQNHNGGLPGGAIPGIEGVGYLDVYSSQWFAIEAFLPTDNPKDYPQYIQNSFASDPDAINQMKFYLILMSLLHSYDGASEPDLKDDRNQTEYSAFLYAYTRALENGHMAAKPQTADQAFAIVAAEEVDLFRDTYGADFYDRIFSAGGNVQKWFTKMWNNAVFMSQFTYSTMDVNGDTKVAVTIPLAPAVLGAGGQYERVWDYSAQTNQVVKNMNAGLKLKGSAPEPGGITVRTENDRLILSAATAEALDDANLSGYLFTISNADGSQSKIQPAGLVSGRPARVATDAKSLQSGAEGQPMFASFSMDVELRVGSTTTTVPGNPPPPSPDGIVRYKHTETFKADYTVNLRKFDSETGQPLENSHWDILENFPDYENQLANTVLEGADNWANDTGTQFEKWEEGEEDPCSLDDNVTNSEGILTYNGSGETAHTDTKLYTYIKGFCGGHPAKPEPEEDPETGEILNQDEIDAWEEEVETCKALLAEGGYFCATAQNGYENGEDASGEESKKQMEDDRDRYYGQFISLYYDYSAEEIQARPGYTIHGTHTDDIPIETKTVTSSQYKDFQKACSGNVENLPHQAAAGTGASASMNMEADTVLRSDLAAPDSAGPAVSTPSDAEAADLSHDTGRPDGSALLDAEATPSDAQLPGYGENSYLEFINTLGTDATATADVLPEDGEDSGDGTQLFDMELADDRNGPVDGKAVISTASNATRSDAEATATASDAEGMMQAAKESWLADLFDSVREAIARFVEAVGNGVKNGMRKAVRLFAGDGPESREGGHLRDTIAWTPDGPGNYVKPLDSKIVDHTFTVFDHRTEGEIHINKKDLDLQAKEPEGEKGAYDACAAENGDGTLEGAVYGLFAASDIIHPDGKTETVYRKDDLVSVATTDRNGDASFMVFTEAPGSGYSYDTGSVTHDGSFKGPGNLHTAEAQGDAFAEDNESYIGHDSKNNAVTLVDSKTGDDTVYYKHSSNQEGIEGLEGGHEVYPVLNNEDNNGNCWIGRPLVADAGGSQYYVKELSRSEGYELSVSGKSNFITNGKDSLAETGNAMDITISAPSYDASNNSVNTMVTGTGVDSDVTLRIRTGKGASFASVYKTTEKYMDTQADMVPKEIPAIADAGDPVILNGSRVEAQAGQAVTVNGTPYTATMVSDPEQPLMGGAPANDTVPGLVEKTTYGTADPEHFRELYNADLLALGYRTPAADAPWLKVELAGANDTDWLGAVSAAMADRDLVYFNRVRITEILNEGGRTYAVIRYDHAAKTEPDSYVYVPEKGFLYVKFDTPDGHFVYAPIPMDSDMVVSHTENETGFVQSVSLKKASVTCNTAYPDDLPVQYAFRVEPPKTYWLYDGTMQRFNNDGTLMTTTVYERVETQVEREREVETLQELPSVYDEASGTYTVTIPQSMFASGEPVNVRIYGKDGSSYLAVTEAARTAVTWKPSDSGTDSYRKNLTLQSPDQDTVMTDSGTISAPETVNERSIRQKVKVEKDIQVFPETKAVWYCGNCGFENADGTASCGFCSAERSSEETKLIDYAHDTYGAVHSENRKADNGVNFTDTIRDWFASLIGKELDTESTKSIPEFRFKAYLKSNLERLYRKGDGTVVWLDRNGNEMTPQYSDTNGDGNYDTFTWKYVDAYGGKTLDFPEKDKVSDDGVLQSANVQRIYTEVPHKKDSMTTSARANGVWETYKDPSEYKPVPESAEETPYTTAERAEGGDAVSTSDALYSYDGFLVDKDQSHKLLDAPNTGYTRILETRVRKMENGADTQLVDVHDYNYEKFFDAVHAANTDIWDDDMHSTYTGDAMGNYPGQKWHETFYEKYQKDDADPGHTMENTDGADKDNTAGGDRDTSFKPFRWIREHVFGGRTGMEQYPADKNGDYTENTVNTSDFARANAEASDAVRQFAVKWYLKDEAAKLMVDNGNGENISIKKLQDGLTNGLPGDIPYDEAVYDEALFEAIAKAYNYLKPFYTYDLDTIYSVEWDSEANGGADKDYTTLSADERMPLEGTEGGTFYGVSGYLPYGIYVIVEQQPERRDKDVNDWKNRSYTTDRPKEVAVPSLYEGTESNDTTDNYHGHYSFDPAMLLTGQAKKDNYLIRFGEENSENTKQDEREFVIRSHGYYGDFEVYKYGLDIDKLRDTISYDGGTYDYGGFTITQGGTDPLKDYYNADHNGETFLDPATRIDAIGSENGGGGGMYLGNDRQYLANGDGAATANGSTYDGKNLKDRFYYASISEDDGTAPLVMYKGAGTNDNNASGMGWEKDVPSTTGELTVYEDRYAPALVPWTVAAPADVKAYSADGFTGYADVNERNTFFATKLRINKTDSETGEYILHDDAVFGLYAASRYNTFKEIEDDAQKFIKDADERARFLMQFKPGDARFFLTDTAITGTKEFLMGMGARDISRDDRGDGHLYKGTVPKGTPVCVESERINLSDDFGNRTGQMTVWSTNADVPATDPEDSTGITYVNQNVGYFETSQPVGAGVYVLAELKPPAGYARSKPVAIEVYSDETQYYADGDMYAKVAAVRRYGNLMEEFPYTK